MSAFNDALDDSPWSGDVDQIETIKYMWDAACKWQREEDIIIAGRICYSAGVKIREQNTEQ